MRVFRFLAPLFAVFFSLTAVASVQPVELRCESAVNPLGVDSASPRLSWQMRSDEPGQRQTAYRVLAASSSAMLNLDRGDLWDSAKIASADSINLTWKGKALASSQQVFWKIQLWDRKDRPTGCLL